MSNSKFELNTSAFRNNVLQADWMLAHVEKIANQRAGADEHILTFYGFDRAKSIIYPNTKEHEG